MRTCTSDLLPGERKILEDVGDHGLHIVHVQDERDGPCWSFSIGLWHHFGHPEVIVFGLPGDVAHELLDLVADEVDAGRRFQAGSTHGDLLEGYPVRFLAVPKAHFRAYLGAAVWAYEGDAFEAVQLVWPDKQGRWPWEDVREGFRTLEPVLERLPASP